MIVVQIKDRTVGSDDISYPGKVFRAGSERAVRSSPVWFPVEPEKAVTIGVDFTSPVMGAMVLTESTLSATPLAVVDYLAPVLSLVRGGTGGHLVRLLRRFSRGLRRWLR